MEDEISDNIYHQLGGPDEPGQDYGHPMWPKEMTEVYTNYALQPNETDSEDVEFYTTGLSLYPQVFFSLGFRSDGLRTKNAVPACGLSKECAQKSQAKFLIEEAKDCIEWGEEILERKLDISIDTQDDFHSLLKDGSILCQLINAIAPGSVKRVNKRNTPFKERENIELYLKACKEYGVQEGGLFQVNDLYEQDNLYMVVDNLFVLGLTAKKKGWKGRSLKRTHSLAYFNDK